TYYIDSDRGSDSNDGHSPDRAWRTLNKVNSFTFKTGDSILFRSGTVLKGGLVPKGSGEKGKPIIISNYGKGEKPKIEGNGIFPATVYLYNVEYWKVQNLDISNKGAVRIAGLCGLKIHARNYGTVHSLVLKNLIVHDVYGSLVKKEGGGAGISVQNQGNRIITTFDSLLIEDCKISRCERNGITFDGYWQRSEWHPNLNVVIRNNEIDEVPGDGIVPIGCDGALIEYNLMHHSSRLLPDGEAAAGIWPWSCDNTIVQYNEVSGHKAPWDGQGFDSDWNCRNTIIQYNYSHDNEGGFLLVCNDGSVKEPYSVGNAGTIVRYNVSINDGIRNHKTRSGIFSPVIHFAGPVKNTLIYNNVIFVPEKQNDSIDHTLINSSNWNGFADSSYFLNNIFYTRGPLAFQLGESTSNHFDSNLYFGKFTNLPHDGHAVFSDPAFVSLPDKKLIGFEGLKCFMLQPGSPCINKGGKVIPAALKDFFGNVVEVGQNPCIGIHQLEP
ncbi:MAG: right-handed parallel beta-helix repeat-containing protein, partial [Bacteroidota bacterium]|nr:right-handed parallel beta-helix repeat-containing protein [Bacteroidota bacterium]